ncbi:MAG: hypothetical protein JWN04_2704 [Myxococcaceae bacterium]|nr:hypothetical protein [Myxococcaceae bacterium]
MPRKTPRALALACLVALAACANADDITSKRDAGALDGERSHVAPGNPVANTDAAATTPSRTSHTTDSDDSCARVQVNVARLVPTVQIVVDASGSMAEPLGDCTTRWDCLRGALIGDAGLVTQLQTTVSFGLTLFGGQIAKIQDGQVVEVLNATCPRILDVSAALDNRDVIAMRYDTANPGGGTPTAEALAGAVAHACVRSRRCSSTGSWAACARQTMRRSSRRQSA